LRPRQTTPNTGGGGEGGGGRRRREGKVERGGGGGRRGGGGGGLTFFGIGQSKAGSVRKGHPPELLDSKERKGIAPKTFNGEEKNGSLSSGPWKIERKGSQKQGGRKEREIDETESLRKVSDGRKPGVQQPDADLSRVLMRRDCHVKDNVERNERSIRTEMTGSGTGPSGWAAGDRESGVPRHHQNGNRRVGRTQNKCQRGVLRKPQKTIARGGLRPLWCAAKWLGGSTGQKNGGEQISGKKAFTAIWARAEAKGEGKRLPLRRRPSKSLRGKSSGRRKDEGGRARSVVAKADASGSVYWHSGQ